MSEPTRYDEICNTVTLAMEILDSKGDSAGDYLYTVLKLLAEWKASHEKDKAENEQLRADLAAERERCLREVRNPMLMESLVIRGDGYVRRIVKTAVQTVLCQLEKAIQAQPEVGADGPPSLDRSKTRREIEYD